jgi:hypothetical protein
VKNENGPSMRTLAHIYDNIKSRMPMKGRDSLMHCTTPPSATVTNAKIRTNPLFSSAAVRSEAEETIPKRPTSLLQYFNGTDAAVLGATAASVPAIAAASGERAPPDDAERAAAFLADFERSTEMTRARHESNPGAGEGNSRLTVEIMYPAYMPLSDDSIVRSTLEHLSVVFRGFGVLALVFTGRGQSSPPAPAGVSHNADRQAAPAARRLRLREFELRTLRRRLPPAHDSGCGPP